MWVVSELILHKLYGNKVSHGWFHRQNFDISASGLPLLQLSSFCCRESACGFVQCFFQLWMWTGTLIVHHCWHLFSHFLSFHSYMLHCGESLSPCCADSVWWISAPVTPSGHKNLITACCCLLHVASGVAMFITLVVQGNWMIKDKCFTAKTGRFHACGMRSALGPVTKKIEYFADSCCLFS
jgi:hypothetical protein